jgi:periplasmic protein TonB
MTQRSPYSRIGDTRWTVAALWLTSGLIVLGVHAAIAAAILTRSEVPEDAQQSGALVIELAPVAVARADAAQNLPSGPDQLQSEASPAKPLELKLEKTTETPPEVAEAEVAAPMLPTSPESEVAIAAAGPLVPPQPEPTPEPQAAAPTTSVTQQVAEARADKAAAPTIGLPTKAPSQALPNWQKRLGVALEKAKRYPSGSQARREQGITQVAFVVDREGRLISSRIAASSGHATLDAEALSMLTHSPPRPPS